MKRTLIYALAAAFGLGAASCADLGFGVDVGSGGVDPYFYGNTYWNNDYWGSPGWSVNPGYYWQPSPPPLIGNGPGSVWNPRPSRPQPVRPPAQPPMQIRPSGGGHVTGSPVIPDRPGNNGMPSVTVGGDGSGRRGR